VLALTTMLFGDEVLPSDRLDELDAIAEAAASERELRMAEQLIASLSAEFEPSKFRDEYRDRVLELIEAKAAGQPIEAPAPVEEPAVAPDLMAALEASLAAVRTDEEPAKPEKARRAPAKSTAKAAR